jgi:hypothetical protein
MGLIIKIQILLLPEFCPDGAIADQRMGRNRQMKASMAGIMVKEYTIREN